MSRRRKPFNRAQQLKAVLAHAKSATRNADGTLQRAYHIALPKIHGPTLEEIFAKYGPIDRTNYNEQH